jgi:hypothetical protein
MLGITKMAGIRMQGYRTTETIAIVKVKAKVSCRLVTSRRMTLTGGEMVDSPTGNAELEIGGKRL